MNHPGINFGFMKLYHKDIGFPSNVDIPYDQILTLTYTQHAYSRKIRDKYKVNFIPTFIRLTKTNVFELELDNDSLRTIKIRTFYDPRRDIILVVEPYFERNVGKVITFWLVYKTDNNINKEKYAINRS